MPHADGVPALTTLKNVPAVYCSPVCVVNALLSIAGVQLVADVPTNAPAIAAALAALAAALISAVSALFSDVSAFAALVDALPACVVAVVAFAFTSPATVLTWPAHVLSSVTSP